MDEEMPVTPLDELLAKMYLDVGDKDFALFGLHSYIPVILSLSLSALDSPVDRLDVPG